MVRIVETVSRNSTLNEIVYQPDNGTRYEVILVLHGEHFLFCWLNGSAGGRCHEFATEGLLHYSYFQEKMKTNEADAAVLLVLIHELTGRTVALPPGYDVAGLYDGVEEGIVLGEFQP